MAHSPIRAINSSDIEKFMYNPDKMEQLLQLDGWTKNKKAHLPKNALSLSLQSLRWQNTRRAWIWAVAEQLSTRDISKGRG